MAGERASIKLAKATGRIISSVLRCCDGHVRSDRRVRGKA